MLVISALTSFIHQEDKIDKETGSRFSNWLKLNKTFPAENGMQSYTVKNVAGGFLMMNISAITVLTGAVIYLTQHGFGSPYYTSFAGEPKRLTDFRSIWQTALQGRGRSIIQLGLLFLIATPIARIIFSFIGFILEKDILYSVITLVVLIIVLFGLF
jgi:uncharacterized membrane protein